MAKAEEKDDVVISKLRIKIAGESKDLTIEQAKKLYHALGELFAEPKVRVEKEYVYWPFRTWTEDRVFTPSWIYCQDNTSTKSNLQLLATDIV